MGPNLRGVDTNMEKKEEGHVPIVMAACVRADPGKRETHMASRNQMHILSRT